MNSKDKINKSLFCILYTSILVAIIGIFEAIKHWHLYFQLYSKYSNLEIMYVERAGFLRVSSVFESPIVLGYVMMIAIGILQYFWLTKFITKINYYSILLILLTCLFLTISRGPWIGTLVMIFVYFILSTQKVDKILKLFVSIIFLVIPFSLTKYWDVFYNLLPFIGKTDSNTISYRERLITMSLKVIKKNPIFGDTNYLDTPEMQSMRQGQGIIDVVNSYIQVTLNIGIIGLLLFLLIFFNVIKEILSVRKLLLNSDIELFWLGVMLISILSGILITISTVSSIGFIPILYWIFISISTAFINISMDHLHNNK